MDCGCPKNLGRKCIQHGTNGLSIREAGKPWGDEDPARNSQEILVLKRKGFQRSVSQTHTLFMDADLVALGKESLVYFLKLHFTNQRLNHQ